MAQIKQFLVSHNISSVDVDEAIAQFNQIRGTQNSQNNSQNYSQNKGSYSDQSTESQLRNYMQTQMSSGYGIEVIKNSLIRQGFNPATGIR